MMIILNYEITNDNDMNEDCVFAYNEIEKKFYNKKLSCKNGHNDKENIIKGSEKYET